ncbi:LytTR family transcriptional regulator DNA-binding domain-containing protein [Lachnospiraceae bacterium MD1]|jgi:DNA-binding LytR/AlgR family response regulator|uniref:LytTR family transcriptional regulator DNA-binding domain-containing protein n=1 Tax=Variimorphobacter saccharofermentans TaxID=2755051 RepID=A0A839K295_9FIRM|nr:LytTR family DNA-binding domain-containing protein [Variimorphobacter saccharofermentans]MBB2183730.1 LytTR family transcriptional regulator DNA-binding domain-containing protein [Variimorphobacter saccharofermentans]
MKLFLEQRKEKEIEVIVRYHEMNSDVKRLVQKIESCNHTVVGSDNGRQYKISIYDIYYIESVDKKTFIYTRDQVFRSEKKLYHFVEELKEYDFVQVSKSCILNLDVLEYIKSLYNSRMEATLINGEKITISRTYLPIIKEALSKEVEQQ